MSDKEIKKEFKDFIKELTVEICTNVCLDKIIEINEEFKSNNIQFNDTTNKVGKILSDNKNNLKLINKNNNEIINEITDELRQALYKREEELEKLYDENSKKFEGIFEGFEDLFKRGLDNEDKLSENNTIISEIANEITGSHESLKKAMNVVDNSNKEHLNIIQNKNDELLRRYEVKVNEFNKEQRNKFIKELSEAITTESDAFSKNIMKNIHIFSSQVMGEFTKENTIYTEKIDKLINDNNINEKVSNLTGIVNTVLNNVEQSNQDISQVCKTVNLLESTMKVESSKISNEILKQNDQVISLIKTENIKLCDSISTIDKRIDVIEYRLIRIENSIKYILIGIALAIVLSIIF